MSHHRESSAFVPVVPTRNVHPVLYPGEMHPLMGAELLRENRERAEMMRENRGDLIRASREDGGTKREAVGGKVFLLSQFGTTYKSGSIKLMRETNLVQSGTKAAGLLTDKEISSSVTIRHCRRLGRSLALSLSKRLPSSKQLLWRMRTAHFQLNFI